MIEELDYVSEQQRLGYDRFESYSLYNSNPNTPKKKIGNEYIFATIVDGYLFRVRQFDFYLSEIDEEDISPYQIVVDMLDIYSNKSSIDATHIKTYDCVSPDQLEILFEAIYKDKKYFWIITDYLKSHGDKLDEDDMFRLHNKLHEFIILKIGDGK